MAAPAAEGMVQKLARVRQSLDMDAALPLPRAIQAANEQLGFSGAPLPPARARCPPVVTRRRGSSGR